MKWVKMGVRGDLGQKDSGKSEREGLQNAVTKRQDAELEVAELNILIDQDGKD